MSDLHTRLLAAVQQRMDAAGSATSGPWNSDDPMSSDGVYAPAVDGYVADCGYERMGPFAVHNAAHIAANDPATVIRHCVRDLAVLGRHAIVWRDIGWREGDDTAYDEIPACGYCVPKHSHFRSRAEVPEGPCPEITDMAVAYGIEVDDA